METVSYNSWYNTVSELDMDMVNQGYESHLFHSHPYDIEYRSKEKIILSREALKWCPLDILSKIKRHQEEF